jgi:ABC-2 type transport system ATP-binding protein
LKTLSPHFALEVEGIRKRFVTGWLNRRQKDALKGIDLSMPKGAFWCLLGPNGAGKTTLLSILSNLLTPDEGRIKVLGIDMRTGSREILRRINISSGHANFLWSMNVRENLNYYAMLYGLSGKKRRERVDHLLRLFDLADYAQSRFDELSTGTKQRLSLAKSLVNEPELLFLDEPTVGLDPDVARKIRDAIRSLHSDEGTTILMTTHNMHEAESMCEQTAFIVEGRIRAVGRPSDLKRDLRLGDTILVKFQGAHPIPPVESMDGVYAVEAEDSSLRFFVDNHKIRLPQLLQSMDTRRFPVNRVEIHESDLEDVFLAFAR